jgi:single-stranded DNA-specific DHH superfamily exonuclease
MALAVAEVLRAREAGEQVTVYGDYDGWWTGLRARWTP